MPQNALQDVMQGSAETLGGDAPSNQDVVLGARQLKNPNNVQVSDDTESGIEPTRLPAEVRFNRDNWRGPAPADISNPTKAQIIPVSASGQSTPPDNKPVTIRGPQGDVHVQFPEGASSTLKHSVSQAIYHAGQTSDTAWDEVKSQGKGLKQTFARPDDKSPKDEQVVSILGPVSLGAYRAGKAFLTQLAAAKEARDKVMTSGEGTPAQILTTLENWPMIGDLTKSFEKGDIQEPIVRGLTRALTMKGGADLSAAALGKMAEVVSPKEVSAPKPVAQSKASAMDSVRETLGGAPLSEVDRTAAAYLRKQRAEGPSGVTEVQGSADEPGTVNIGGKTQRVRGEESKTTTPTAEEINTAIKNLYGEEDAPQIKIIDESATPKKATSEELNAAAEHTIDAFNKSSASHGLDLGEAKDLKSGQTGHNILLNGKKIGEIRLSINTNSAGERTGAIQWVGAPQSAEGSIQMELSNKLGVSGVRALKRTLEDVHDLDSVAGFRVRGAKPMRSVKMAAEPKPSKQVTPESSFVPDMLKKILGGEVGNPEWEISE